MPLLDIGKAKRARSEQWPERRRTLGDPGTVPAGLLNGSGGAGGFAAAKINRLTMDFIASSRSADQDLFGDNIRLRARARKLALDNPFARKFLAMVVQNVVGPAGILMQAKVKSVNGKDTAETQKINQRIEEEWLRWGEAGSCSACGRFSWVDLQQLAVANCAREGENLEKLVFGRQFNDSGFALQPLDNDQLDDTMMAALGNSAEVRMGVEVDQYRRPLGYWLWSGHPNDIFGGRNRERVRVPAAQIIHTAKFDRPGQTRAYTWLAAAILELNQYSRYEEAVVVAARASAAKFAVIESNLPEGWSPDDEDEAGDDRNADGTAVMTANAGEIPELDPGQSLNFTDPRFPTNTHKDFTQTLLRNVASGLLVSYPSLANDLEGVNFSSIRAGLLDERDCWRVIQKWFIEHFCKPVFQAWLGMALLTTLSDITLTPSQRRQVSWRPRGWEWVDPQKDANAAVLRLSNGLSTYSHELGQLGRDFEPDMDERASEQKYIEGLQARFGLKYPVVLGTDLAGDQAGKGVASTDGGSEEEVAAAQAASSTDKGAKK